MWTIGLTKEVQIIEKSWVMLFKRYEMFKETGACATVPAAGTVDGVVVVVIDALASIPVGFIDIITENAFFFFFLLYRML